MTDNLHTRAQELFAKSLVQNVATTDRSWLDQHLRDCPDCAREILSTQDLLSALRKVPISMPKDLAARTQLRVRIRAQETAPASQNGILLWLITGMSWLLGIFSAPLVWRGFAWAGSHLSIPKVALEMGFVLWWVLPALFAVGAILHQRAMNPSQSDRQN